MNSKKLFNNFLKIFETKATVVVLAVVAFVFVLAPVALALDTGLDYGTLSGLGTQDLRVSIMKIVRIFLGFVGIIAIIITLYAGYIWMTSGGNAEKIDTAKRTLRNAAIGLVIIFSAFAIVSFIISALEGSTGVPGIPGGQPPGGGCVNCGHLGGGVIQSVYPTPFQRDVPRNTNIQVTFKVTMQPDTIIDGSSASCSVASPCQGNLVSNNVKIFKASENEDANKLNDSDVVVTSTDGKTFIMDVVDYLGDSANKTWYSVKLDNGILKDNGQSAFPGANDFFLWQFEVGTFLDLDPVEVSNVFPPPDDAGDDYAQTSAQPATATLAVLTNTKSEVQADATITSGPAGASISGTYNGQTNASIVISINAGGTADVDWGPGNINNNPNAVINGNALTLGNGLQLIFSTSPVAGSQWQVAATAFYPSDTLRIGSRLYTFVAGTPSANQIQIGNTLSVTAANIVDALADNLDVDASVSGLSSVVLSAKVAGSQGNNIVVQTRGTWSSICSGNPLVCQPNQNNLALGSNQVLNPTTNDAPDQPKNTIISIEFNEPIDVSKVNGNTMIVQYDADPTAGENWQTVPGVYLFSNQFRTVEFLSENACTDGFGNPVINSCGESIYCLPTVSPDPDPYQATHYRVIVKAGFLKQCSGNADCSDPNFNTCVATGNGQACQGTFGSVDAFYPEVRNPGANGITDAANNSFNGNKDTFVLNGRTYGKADGPSEQSGQAAFNLNDNIDQGFGDDLVWHFYINKTLNLVPPKIATLGPNINQSAISLTEAPSATFDKMMSSSTLKPGSNYRDGYCYCDNDSQCNTAAGEACDTVRNKCVNADLNAQAYCEQDNECGTNRCDNKKFVTLIDRSNPRVGWWITKEDLDTGIPRDGYGDQTQGFIRHSIFNEVTSYGAEFGSGIKDIYQNCYFPGGGPDVGPLPNVNCPVTPTTPYCCGGVAYSQDDWEDTPCFTGY